jgi:hypothetical protein
VSGRAIRNSFHPPLTHSRGEIKDPRHLLAACILSARSASGPAYPVVSRCLMSSAIPARISHVVSAIATIASLSICGSTNSLTMTRTGATRTTTVTGWAWRVSLPKTNKPVSEQERGGEKRTDIPIHRRPAGSGSSPWRSGARCRRGQGQLPHGGSDDGADPSSWAAAAGCPCTGRRCGSRRSGRLSDRRSCPSSRRRP